MIHSSRASRRLYARLTVVACLVAGLAGLAGAAGSAGAAGAVLYDQTAATTPIGYVSYTSTSSPTRTAQLADDFNVPTAQGYTITEVDAAGTTCGNAQPASFNVFFYRDNGSGLPGTLVAQQNGLPYTTTTGPTGTCGGNLFYNIPLSTSVTIAAGTAWVSVQANAGTSVWFWLDIASVMGNQAAFQNPGNGFATGCTTYKHKSNCGAAAEDQQFRLLGSAGTNNASVTANHNYNCTNVSMKVSANSAGFPSGNMFFRDYRSSGVPGRCSPYGAGTLNITALSIATIICTSPTAVTVTGSARYAVYPSGNGPTVTFTAHLIRTNNPMSPSNPYTGTYQLQLGNGYDSGAIRSLVSISFC